MFKKGTKIYSILTGTCPKCHEESMFKNKNPYILSQALSMHENCSNCKTKYKMEPSFFYGSMYVSYPVGIAFATAAFVISFFVFKAEYPHNIYIHNYHFNCVYAHYFKAFKKYLD